MLKSGRRHRRFIAPIAFTARCIVHNGASLSPWKRCEMLLKCENRGRQDLSRRLWSDGSQQKWSQDALQEMQVSALFLSDSHSSLSFALMAPCRGRDGTCLRWACLQSPPPSLQRSPTPYWTTIAVQLLGVWEARVLRTESGLKSTEINSDRRTQCSALERGARFANYLR